MTKLSGQLNAMLPLMKADIANCVVDYLDDDDFRTFSVLCRAAREVCQNRSKVVSEIVASDDHVFARSAPRVTRFPPGSNLDTICGFSSRRYTNIRGLISRNGDLTSLNLVFGRKYDHAVWESLSSGSLSSLKSLRLATKIELGHAVPCMPVAVLCALSSMPKLESLALLNMSLPDTISINAAVHHLAKERIISPLTQFVYKIPLPAFLDLRVVRLHLSVLFPRLSDLVIEAAILSDYPGEKARHSFGSVTLITPDDLHNFDSIISLFSCPTLRSFRINWAVSSPAEEADVLSFFSSHRFTRLEYDGSLRLMSDDGFERTVDNPSTFMNFQEIAARLNLSIHQLAVHPQ